MNIKEGLTFDDLLLVPKYSEIESRSKIDVSVKMGKFNFKHPIIPANMASILGPEMASKIIESGGLAILHRFMPLAEQISICEDLIEHYGPDNLGISVGVKEEDKKAIKQFVELGVKIVCIDIAHGDSLLCVKMTRWIRENYPNMFIIAGAIATGSGAVNLWKAGADAVRCGVGSGSICTTRIQTGNGAPLLTSLIDVAEAREKLLLTSPNKKYYIISDGGCKSPGDVCKALCFADMVMAGNIFAGAKETPSNLINIAGTSYKEYAGSSTHKASHIEGVVSIVNQSGTYNEILTKLLEGLTSGMSYQNANNLEELRKNPEFIRITNAGLIESHPHDVIVR